MITIVGLKTKKLMSKFFLLKGTEHAISYVCTVYILALLLSSFTGSKLPIYVFVSENLQIRKTNHKTRIPEASINLKLLSRKVPNWFEELNWLFPSAWSSVVFLVNDQVLQMETKKISRALTSSTRSHVL